RRCGAGCLRRHLARTASAGRGREHSGGRRFDSGRLPARSHRRRRTARRPGPRGGVRSCGRQSARHGRADTGRRPDRHRDRDTADRTAGGSAATTEQQTSQPTRGRRPRSRGGMMASLITTDLVALDVDQGTESSAVIRAMATAVAEQGRASSADDLAAAAIAREEKTPTGVPGGIAIPHARTEAVTEPSLVMARLNPPVDFGAKDGPADLVFMIAAPEGAGKEHLALLSKLARSLVKKDFVASLRAAESAQEVVDLVETALALRDAEPAPAESAASAAEATPGEPSETAATTAAGSDSATTDSYSATTDSDSAEGPRRVVAVTACPTGIAHTYMAADALVAAGSELGVEVVAEPQGSSGTTPIDASVIEAADAVVFAVDVDVRDKARFVGKPYVQVPVKAGIDDPQGLIRKSLAEAADPNGHRVTVG